MVWFPTKIAELYVARLKLGGGTSLSYKKKKNKKQKGTCFCTRLHIVLGMMLMMNGCGWFVIPQNASPYCYLMILRARDRAKSDKWRRDTLTLRTQDMDTTYGKDTLMNEEKHSRDKVWKRHTCKWIHWERRKQDNRISCIKIKRDTDGKLTSLVIWAEFFSVVFFLSPLVRRGKW